MSQAPNIHQPLVDDRKRATVQWWTWLNGLSNGFSGTITTAKITPGGANGSMTFQNGVLVSQTAAT